MSARPLLALVALLALPPLVPAARPQDPVRQDLGRGKMWTFENPPLAYLRRQYGFEPSTQWLEALRLASLKFGRGCSASFVSPKGLIVTNHHCARRYIEAADTEGAGWLDHGFVAASLDDEVRLPRLSVRQLVSMRDVTAEMDDGIEGDTDPATARRIRRNNAERLRQQATADHPDLHPTVVALHRGAIHELYLYKVWDDVRLVCAPHLQIANFGGDPDNFTYPRYSIDFTFCRAYENGRPADTSRHYFRWSKTGAKPGELVFVTGNPGSTARLQTVAQMEFLRDVGYPILRQLLDHRLALMRRVGREHPDLEARLRTAILSYENARKAYRGYHEALLDDDLMARKRASEAAFKARVQADPELREKFGHLWTDLEQISLVEATTEPARRFHVAGGSPQLHRAIAVVDALQSGSERDRERALHLSGTSGPLEHAMFVDHLERACQWLPERDPYRLAVLGGRSAEAAARELETSEIADDDFVRGLLEGGEAVLHHCGDPAIRTALAVAPLQRARGKLASWLDDQKEALEARLGRALFACYGDRVSPDATGTLRFSDGVVAGFPYNGTRAPPRTSFYGLYARYTDFGGKPPFDLPRVWLDRKDRIDLRRSVNFVSTNDIIGGNSGSPTVNRDLEVVGIVFDGNIDMLRNRFLYSDDVPRAVSVHVDAIMVALRQIYGAGRIADELLGR